ncbi:MAG: RimK family alpha-L-glutamate ligase [Candidatus Aenigmarchaeota archaeon]|nr:RimK family alpha-L-glutamate ligase [Candidatus Aenigmarchaeota archaeon]
MKLAILGPLKRRHEEIRLIGEAKKVFDSVSYFCIPNLTVEITDGECFVKHKNIDLSSFDCILPRIPRSYRTFGFTVLKILEGKVFFPIKPISLFYSHNKFSTLLLLKENNLPVPETYLALKRSVTENVLDEIVYPVVLKLLYGSMGRGVIFADSKQSAITFIDTLELFKQPIFVEEYVKNPGEDIRAYVIGDRVIASMKRIAKKNERRSNIGVGGKGIKYDIPQKIADLACDAAGALGMEICGVDIIEGPKGPTIIETNINAQFQGLESATKRNVARQIVEYLKERVKK